MKPNQDLYDITSGVLLGMRNVLREAQPDIVLVHGDTTTCFAASLAAFYEGIPIGHVEAGLRTGNMRAPFPEEANRSLVGRLAESALRANSTCAGEPARGKRPGQPDSGYGKHGHRCIADRTGKAEKTSLRVLDGTLRLQPYLQAKQRRTYNSHHRTSSGEFRTRFRRLVQSHQGSGTEPPRMVDDLPGALKSERPRTCESSSVGISQYSPNRTTGLPTLRVADDSGGSDTDGFRRHTGRGAVSG